MALLLSQFANTNHESGDGGVVRELLNVASNLLDELMDTLQRILGGRLVSHKPVVATLLLAAAGGIEQCPKFLQEAVATVDAVGVPWLAGLNRT